jgi:hypothetical protein
MRYAIAMTLFALAANASAAQSDLAITRVRIAAGSFNTAERTVSLALDVQGSPTAMRISEKSDMSGVLWKKFSSTPSFTLSSDPGFKVVFVQIGKAKTLSSTLPRTGDVSINSGDFVPAPAIVSAIARDTIILGLPDLRSKVIMPATVKDNEYFDFEVQISNAGQLTPPNQVIHVYNSFVTNTLSMEHVDVNFMLQNLVGDGCVFTDVPTIECSLAQMPPGRIVGLQLRAKATRAVPSSQTQATYTLRTRIIPIQESNTSNNWRDTPITIVK